MLVIIIIIIIIINYFSSSLFEVGVVIMAKISYDFSRKSQFTILS